MRLKKIIYFDGICNLCNWWVRFVIKHDKKRVFSFAQLQSKYAADHIEHANGQYIKLKSIIYQDHHIFYTKSNAVLKIIKDMGGVWRLFYILRIIPSPLLDWAYDLIARNRYHWFGKKNNCMIPPPEVKDRFLE